MNREKFGLLVKLTFAPDKRAEFEAFERTAVALMKGYGGEIVYALRPHVTNAEETFSTEWHLVTFPDESSFQAYGQDARVAALQSTRDAIILKTEVMRGIAISSPYSDPAV